MKLFNKIVIFYLFFLLYSCADYKVTKKSTKLEKKFFSSSGFALIYDENLYNEGLISKKIKKNEIIVYHDFLKKNTPIKIINPENSKAISTKINGKAKYPDIFAVTITKKVADKAPVDDIQIKELGKSEKKTTLVKKDKFKYIIKIGDFYFEKSAKQMKSRIIDETTINNVKINKISKTKFRVLLGPYNNLNSLSYK